MDDTSVKTAVKEAYGRIAQGQNGCGCDCGGGSTSAEETARSIGYSDRELDQAPAGANLGLGCGNPTAITDLQPGERVLDLGSGAGFDCFLAADAVGATGRVIGVDMTPAMIDKARHNADRGGYRQVEFRLGEIEDLPVTDGSIDAVISNCVINLAPDKERVFREAQRVLRPGGRMMVADIVLTGDLPEDVRNSETAYVDCVAGAAPRQEYLATIKAAGFQEIEIMNTAGDPGAKGDQHSGSLPIASITIRAVKPRP
ncbi:MAG: arsenite methyltransferase [Candidatus Marinimicrobia bacterium]|nr:arsenite methyltransferase [Candidatus Neomarinimicrobiota bacterium]